MLAEAAHSWADTTNRVFLLFALRRSRRPAATHPFGYGRGAGRRSGLGLLEQLRRSTDPTVKTVASEDSAAVVGLVLAAGARSRRRQPHPEHLAAVSR